MAGNKLLQKAKTAKKDEFYTRLEDIEAEVRHYWPHFRGKTVLCNCDDPFESNFFKYFALHFNHLGIKRLIATCYDGSIIGGTQLELFDLKETKPPASCVQDIKPPASCSKTRVPHKIVINELGDFNGDGTEDLRDIVLSLQQNKRNTLTRLKGNGDFRSDECVELLKEADIVVTNPPFSLFREYVAELVKHEKKFLIVGPMNALTYREIFPLIKDGKLWLGFGFPGNAGYFKSEYEDVARAGKHLEGMIRVSGVTWFTNLDHQKRHEEMILFKKFSEGNYPKYVNYDAIEVSRVEDIPCDYAGEMGVPITFLDKFNPDQFELIGISSWLSRPMKEIALKGTYSAGGPRFYIEQTGGQYKYKRLFDRLVIRNKHPQVGG